MGLVQNLNSDEKAIQINFLHSSGPSNSFSWYKGQDVSLEPYTNVICKMRPPTTQIGWTDYLEGRKLSNI